MTNVRVTHMRNGAVLSFISSIIVLCEAYREIAFQGLRPTTFTSKYLREGFISISIFFIVLLAVFILLDLAGGFIDVKKGLANFLSCIIGHSIVTVIFFKSISEPVPLDTFSLSFYVCRVALAVFIAMFAYGLLMKLLLMRKKKQSAADTKQETHLEEIMPQQ